MTLKLRAVLTATFLVTLMGAASPQRWGGAWGYAPAGIEGPQDIELPPGTYRYRATLTQQGTALALTFSNAEGDRPVTIARATVAPASGSDVESDGGTETPLRFGGSEGAALPVGRAVISDPLPFITAVGQPIVVSVTFSTPTRPARTNLGLPMAFAAAGGRFQPVQLRPYLSLVSVRDPAAPCTIVAFGDSITDGFLAISPTTRGWPGRLAERLAALPPERRCGVVNMGISGNRVLRDGRAINALDRFWRDVASVPGVTHVILLEGINDIGASGADGQPLLTAAELIAGYRQFIARGHALGLKVIGATMTPAVRAGYMSPAKDRVRKAVNAFIRTGGAFDGVIDFDAAVRDSGSPDDLRPAFDPGDHLHPNDAGLKAMGDAIDLQLFAPAM